jgi:hypothetical protein
MTPVCVCTHTPHTPRAVCEHTHGLAGCACANTPKLPATDKLADKRKSASAATIGTIEPCGHRAMDDESIAARPAEFWHLSFRAEGDGPPIALRIRALLKRALRTHGLRCCDFSVTPGPAMDGRPLPPACRGVAAGRAGVEGGAR